MGNISLTTKEKKLSSLILALTFAFVLFYNIFIQFLSPALYEGDSYYHVAVANFIKNFGPRYEFRWAQFSTFTNSFSDKDFLFHVFIIPFLYLTNNILLAAKLAVVFYNALFLLVYAFIIRKYIPNLLAACLLLYLIFSFNFSIYFLYLRPATLANIFTILGIYFLINKKWVKLFILSLLYPLAHISFFMIIVFAVVCEAVRYILTDEFFFKNIYFATIGSLLGCFLHPNYPHNWTSIYLNAYLVPLYSIKDIGFDFGGELFSYSLKKAIIDNFALFFTFNIVLWMLFIKRIKVSLSTLMWWGCTNVYMIFSFLSNRNWYTTNVLFFIFFASYIKDWLSLKERKEALSKIRISIITYAFVFLLFIAFSYKEVTRSVRQMVTLSSSYERFGNWMKLHIPEGETIYHSSWGDSPYFICLNPKNNYFVVLDPIYMFAYSPEKYKLYTDLKKGKIDKPSEVLSKTFKVKYGFVRQKTKLSRLIKEDHTHFKVLYDDGWGIVFEVMNNEKKA
ncbi:MAG: hypothetical protein Q8O30_02775 [Candidatus Omnitrophota bacterium]|nr:hypothetical protein [Candidatus Omnitrophota bacterium]